MRTNSDWLNELRSTGRLRETALTDLRSSLLKGLSRALSGWVKTSGREFEVLADDFVQETLLKVLESLDSYRGLSQFTTWAHRIAVRVALTELRRRRWKDVSLDSILESEGAHWVMESPAPGPDARAERTLSLEYVQKVMAEELTEKQRMALAVAFGGMPLEEAARRMGTNRNALYKIIHDARLKLKRRIAREGMSVQGMKGGLGNG